ncbi:hypothetical protein ACFX2I_028138 [Malus domestica]
MWDKSLKTSNSVNWWGRGLGGINEVLEGVRAEFGGRFGRRRSGFGSFGSAKLVRRRGFGGGRGVDLGETKRQVVVVEWCFWLRLRTTATVTVTAEKGEVVLG